MKRLYFLSFLFVTSLAMEQSAESGPTATAIINTMHAIDEALFFYSSTTDYHSLLFDKTDQPYKVLRKAILCRNNSWVRALLPYVTDATDLNKQDYWGKTCLHDAIRLDDPEIIRELIAKGASINAQDNRGCTPLFEAVWDGAEKIVHTLLEYDECDVTIQDNCNRTPLGGAIDAHMDGAIIEKLFARGASLPLFCPDPYAYSPKIRITYIVGKKKMRNR